MSAGSQQAETLSLRGSHALSTSSPDLDAQLERLLAKAALLAAAARAMRDVARQPADVK